MRLRAHAGLTLAAILVALCWSAFLALPHLRGGASFLDRLEAPLTDLRFLAAGPRQAPDDVVIVAIDDETVRLAGRYPLPRDVLARLVRRIAEAGPKAIVIDMLFLDAGEEAKDAALAAALAAAPSAIGAAAVFARGSEARASFGPFENLPVAERLLLPIGPLRAAARIGGVNVATDHGGTPRHIPLLVAEREAIHPALALLAASIASQASPEVTRDHVRLGVMTSPVDLGASLAIRFYGPRGTVGTLSAREVLDGTVPNLALKGRVAVIGATAFGSGDTLATPFDPVLPGVEVLATGISHLLRGDALVRTGATRWIDAGLALALPVLVLLLLAVRRVAVGIGLAGLVLCLLVLGVFLAFAQGYWLSLSLPLAAVAVPVALYLAARIWLDRWQERRLEAARDGLLRFHPPALAARLERQPDFLEEPVEQGAVVLFLDLSGFTGLSEHLGPVRTRALLKEMHDCVEDSVTPRGGSVTAFMGDGAMVLFGLPDPRADDADRAFDAALSLARALLAWIDARVVAPGLGRGGLRVGVHAGPVVLSRLGGARNQHITATGDTVNVTSRLLEVAKAEAATLVVSAPLVAAMRVPPAPARLGERKQVAIRGRREPLVIQVIRDLADPDAAAGAIQPPRG